MEDRKFRDLSFYNYLQLLAVRDGIRFINYVRIHAFYAKFALYCFDCNDPEEIANKMGILSLFNMIDNDNISYELFVKVVKIFLDDFNDGIRICDTSDIALNLRLPSYNQALICDKCFNITPIEIKARTFYPFEWTTKADLYFGIGALCPKCKQKMYHYAVDINIARAVSYFNKLKYYTEYSCEGHANIVYDIEHQDPDRLNPYYLFNYTVPYVDIKGKKKLTKKLYKELCKIGWDLIRVRPNDDPNVDQIINIEDPVGYKNFDVYLNEDLIIAKIKDIVGDSKSKKVDQFNEQLNEFFYKKDAELAAVLEKIYEGGKKK